MAATTTEQAARKIVDWARAQLADPAEPDFQLPLLTAIYDGLRLRIKAAIEQAAKAERAAADRILTDMQAEVPAYLQGQADALAWVEAQVRRCQAEQPPAAALQCSLLHIESRRSSLSLPVAVERVRLRVGTFEADLDETCNGTVTLDGSPLMADAFQLRCAVGVAPELNVALVPRAVNPHTDGTPATTRD